MTTDPTFHHDPGTRCDGCHSFGYDEGYAAALSAAVEAVKAIPAYSYLGTPLSVVQRDEAVAAIEALQDLHANEHANGGER